MSAFTLRMPAALEGLPRSYWFLLAGSLVNRAGSFVVPMLAVYLTDHRHLSMTEAGLVAAAYGAGSLVGGLLGGASADRLGRRPTLLFSLTGGALAMLAFGVATGFVALASCAFALGLVGDMYRPAIQAAVVDITPPDLRMRAFTWNYWAINLGFSIAAVLGGALAASHFRELFFGDALTTLGCAALIAIGVPETRPPSAAAANADGSLLTPFTDRRFVAFLFACLLSFFVFFQHVVALPLSARHHGLTAFDIGLAAAVNGVLIVMLQPLVPRVLAGRNRAWALALSSVLTAVGFALTAWATDLPRLMLTVGVWTLGEMIAFPLQSEIIGALAPGALRGRYQGAFGLSIGLALTLTPLVSPPLIEALGFSWFWAACGLVGLASAVLHVVQPYQHFIERAETPSSSTASR